MPAWKPPSTLCNDGANPHTAGAVCSFAAGRGHDTREQRLARVGVLRVRAADRMRDAIDAMDSYLAVFCTCTFVL